MRRLAVGDIMTRNFVSVGPLTNLLDCAKKLVKERLNTLLIVEKSRLLGILTSRDILWALIKKININLKEIRAIDVATKKVAVIKPSADMSQALDKMKILNFRRLPVLSKGNIIGVITLKDILRVEPSLYSELGELARIREEEKKLSYMKEVYPLEGLCENCGAFAEILKVDNKLLCQDCRDELY